MLARPDVSDDALRACLRAGWGWAAVEIRFLPLGADANTAAFRVVAAGGTPWFVKLRYGTFDPVSVEIPGLLHDRGVDAVIPPIPTGDGALSATLGPFTVLVFPFAEGTDAIAHPLDLAGLTALGRALRRIHDASLPEVLRARLPREAFSSAQRARVRAYLALAARGTFADPVAARAAALLCAEREVVLELVARAEARAVALCQRAVDDSFVLCHADLHAWNLLVANDGSFRIIDWDTVVLAPRELDLMMPGSGIGNVWSAPEEVAAFRAGYGSAAIDVDALAYFREERIIVDIAADCDVLLAGGAGDADRERALGFLSSSFGPDGLIAFTRRHDPTVTSS